MTACTLINILIRYAFGRAYNVENIFEMGYKFGREHMEKYGATDFGIVVFDKIHFWRTLPTSDKSGSPLLTLVAAAW